MTVRGLDFAWSKPSPQAMRAGGYTFACRYLSYDRTGKNLTPAEANALASAGIDVVSNWEYEPRAPLYGAPQGRADAAAALVQAHACGAPAGRPIYFSVDFDASEAQQPAINAYLRACAEVLGGPEHIGVYAGYHVVKRCLDAGVCRWAWQTFAWSGGQWDPRAHLRQVRNGVQVGGADCDINEAMTGDFGQWRPGQTPPPDDEGDDMDATQAQQLQDVWAWLAQIITDEDVSTRPEDRFRFHNPLRARLETLTAAVAESAKREQAMLTVLDKLTGGGGSVDVGIILAAIRDLGAAESAAVTHLQGQVTDLRARLAAAGSSLASDAHTDAAVAPTSP